MKNHWLNKKKDKQEEAILDAVCNEMATGEITIGAGWSSNDVKIEDITWDNSVFDFGGQPLCISDTTYPDNVSPDLATTSITVSNDWPSFEPGQTALAELDMEIGNGSIKYTRETTIGIFTFKDAGELGVDIFQNGIKVGWLNNQGEKALKQWLNEKPTTLATTTHMGSTYTIGIDPAISHLNDTYFFKKEVYPDYKHKVYDRNLNSYNIKEVSNEVIQITCNANVYQIENKNIVPGSLILTAYVNGVAVQSENLKADGELPCAFYGFSHTYACERPAFSEAKLDHNTSLITVNWVNYNSTDNRILNVCYEYKDYEVKESKLKERWPTIC